MKDLFVMFKDWPVIVQGALGSALFWLILKLFERIFNNINKAYSSLSVNSKRNWTRSEIAKLEAVLSKSPNDAGPWLTILVYRCLRDVVRALIWLCMGMVGQSVISGMGIVGFVGCLYYLFKAAHSVAPIENKDKSEEQLKQLYADLKELKK
ncbi:hypothetical protein NTH35_002435 [Vibrio fluvialis]|uniref:hypothetical protein n=1 Tax=Vibrio fluvialis TaxID=676 RepID=UPI001C9CD9AB|nr:hypothetical protein [Vibrio fluvialis]EKO3430886.1 hypothetical protein [Vibrio fluvialis]EKO3917796.1 hypothetical protein [Vibrio fluvialis]EKO4007018.1 hypothetical protein [Vibrio fluvialis]ELS8947888.1 hypothetical protein [Vibrio fluvialis]MBY8122136.1 hypothetical protein [Vibrio fluvialis]